MKAIESKAGKGVLSADFIAGQFNQTFPKEGQEARFCILPDAIQNRINNVTGEYEKGLRFIQQVLNIIPRSNGTEPKVFWLCGSARTVPPLTDALQKAAREIFLSPNDNATNILKRCSIDLDEVKRAIGEANTRIGEVNQLRAQQGGALLPPLPNDVTFKDLARDLNLLAKGQDSRFFGSHDFTLAELFGEELAKRGYHVVTGGGPGQMQAANRGNHMNGGHSIGLAVKLPHEECSNPFTSSHTTMENMWIRQDGMIAMSGGAIMSPGGIGTKSEFANSLYVGLPIIFAGQQYWKREVCSISEQLRRFGFQPPPECAADNVYDSISLALDNLEKKHIQRRAPTNEEIAKRTDDCRLELTEAYLALWREGFLSRPIATVVVPDLPEPAEKREQFLASLTGMIKDCGRDSKVLVAGCPAACQAAKEVLPDCMTVGLEKGNEGPSWDIKFSDSSLMHDFLRSASKQYIVMPGGIESVYRCFDSLCLLQIEKMKKSDCRLVLAAPKGMEDYWFGILDPSVKQADMRPYHAKADVNLGDAVYELKIGDEQERWISIKAHIPID